MREAERRDRFLADEMLQHLDVVALSVKAGRARLATDPEPRYALEHAIEMLSEAGEKTSRAFKTANPGIPWRALRQFRHDVVHPYDVGASRIEIDQLWRFAVRDAPRLARRLRTARFPADPALAVLRE